MYMSRLWRKSSESVTWRKGTLRERESASDLTGSGRLGFQQEQMAELDINVLH